MGGRPKKYKPGDTHGYWTITAICETPFYLCRCVCGLEKKWRVGGGISCGCQNSALLKKSYAEKRARGIQHPSRTHGYGGTRVYNSWKRMWERCTSKQHPSYHQYGGRGISVDPRWADFTVFLIDMGERPADTSLDRINPDGNYEPSNCRWSDSKTQIANRRTVVQVSLERLRKLEAFALSHGVKI